MNFKLNLKRMGVMNITPDSFSDGGELISQASISSRMQFLNQFEAIDIGAESTAPMNASISWKEEWERWQMVLPFLKDLSCVISADTYHPETIFELVKFWKDQKLEQRLIWNDISGKFDEAVAEFLKTGFDYVLGHNLAPYRNLSGRHMDYFSPELDLVDYFKPYIHKQIIFDPCLGFSKSYEQNWEILKSFGQIQEKVGHDRWLIGYSRKSFLRKKYQTSKNEELDRFGVDEFNHLSPNFHGELWFRTHRPDLVSK